MELNRMNGLTLHDFTQALASKEPTPGDGSTAALVGELGCALAKMTANLTVGKRRYEKYETELNAFITEMNRLSGELAHSIELDADAILAVREAIFMPDGTMDERQEKVDVMDLTLKASAMVPNEVMEKCLSALILMEGVMDKLNDDALSNLGGGATFLGAAVKSAYLSSLATMRSLDDDRFKQKYTDRAKEILTATHDLTEKIFHFALQKVSA